MGKNMSIMSERTLAQYGKEHEHNERRNMSTIWERTIWETT